MRSNPFCTGLPILVYLDIIINTHQGQNEIYVCELMELHTQSLEGGYTQTDVNTVFPGCAMPAFLDMFQDR